MPKASVTLSDRDHRAAKIAAIRAEVPLTRWIEALVQKKLKEQTK